MKVRALSLTLLAVASMALPFSAEAAKTKNNIGSPTPIAKPSVPKPVSLDGVTGEVILQRSDKPSADFIPALDDIPLMPGLAIVTDKDMVFIGRSGRIAEATAHGPVDIDEVYYFYESTLPQLGWKKITPTLYMRDKETLSVDANATGEDAQTVVHFSVKPN